MLTEFLELNKISSVVYNNNKEKGFWDNERNVGETLMLCVTELAEALESHRKGRKADLDAFEHSLAKENFKENFVEQFKLHMKDTFEDEIADTMIRLFDLCGGFNIDIAAHLYYKLEYNKTRERLHGKKY